MGGPLGQDEAVATAAECFDDVVEDLFVACVVLGQRAVDRRDRAGHGQVDVLLTCRNLVGWTTRTGRGRSGPAPSRVSGLGGVEGVPDRTELESDEVVESVAAVGRGGEPEPVAGGDGADGGLECGRRHVMALVDDDEAVAAERLGEVVASGEGLQGGDVDDRR